MTDGTFQVTGCYSQSQDGISHCELGPTNDAWLIDGMYRIYSFAQICSDQAVHAPASKSSPG